jgi:hypothetical protein
LIGRGKKRVDGCCVFLKYNVNFAANLLIMKSKTTIALGIVMMVLGAVAITCRHSFDSRDVVKLGGILVILASFISEFTPRVAKKVRKGNEAADAEVTSTKTSGEKMKGVLRAVVDCAAALFGLVMLWMIDAFVPYIPVTFGLVVFIGSVMMFYNLAVGIRPIMLPGWMYAFPIVLLVLAVAVYEQTTPADDAVVMALTGASACIYGIGTVLSSVLVAKVSRIVTDKSEIKSLDDNE